MEGFYALDDKYFDTEENEEFPEDEKTRRGEFTKYVKSYKTEKALSHRIHSEVTSVGGRKTHKAEVEYMVFCDIMMRHCKLHLNSLRTPVTEEERQNWEMKSTMEILYPEMPKSYKDLLSQKHRELSIIVDSRWGSEDKNELNIKIQGEQSKEMKKWMNTVTDLKNEEMFNDEEYSRLVQASMLNQYKMVAHYDIKSPVSRAFFERIYSDFKTSAPFFKSSTEYGRYQKNIVRAQLTVEPSTGLYANISVHTPSEKLVLKGIRLPHALPHANIRRPLPTEVRSTLKAKGTSMCTVESNKVRTFDDVDYRTPLTTCYSLLAKDCSSEDPEFAVLMKKVSKNGEEKKINVLTSIFVYEMEMDKKTKEVVMTRDGEEVERYTDADDVVLAIGNVYIRFDGYTAKIEMNEHYKNKQCGICGHFDGEKMDEFRGADNKETENLEEFHRSFLVKGDECEMEETKLKEKKNYRIESDSEEMEYETVEPIEKTRVIEYSNRVCFSKTPVRECPTKTMEREEKEKKEIKVKFACLSRSNSETSRLIREARREVLDIADLPESFVETIYVPRVCEAY